MLTWFTVIFNLKQSPEQPLISKGVFNSWFLKDICIRINLDFDYLFSSVLPKYGTSDEQLIMRWFFSQKMVEAKVAKDVPAKKAAVEAVKTKKTKSPKRPFAR